MLYTFRAKNFQGQEITGNREAKNEAELARSLRSEGYVLIKGHKSQDYKSQVRGVFSFKSFFKRVSLSEKMLFTRHLSVMIGAGLSLNRALAILNRQTNNLYFQSIISGIGDNVSKGGTFAGSLGHYPRIFDDLFVKMINVGEIGGNLEEVLKMISYQLEKDYELRSKVKGSLMYPAVIVAAMVIIGIVMMIFVVPKLTATFNELNINLPITTRFVVRISNFLANHTLVFIAGVVLFIYFFLRIIKTRRAKEAIDFVFLNMPIARNIVIKINTARMARTLASLLKSGVAIVNSLEIVSKTLTNRYFSQSLSASAVEVRKGKNLSEVLANYEKIYPPLVTQMIAVGEETGTIDDVLSKLADFYEEEVYNITKNLSTIIEPILMILIGAAVGFFAVSMIQPMYSIIEGL